MELRIDPSLQKVHGSRVPQGVRRESSIRKRRAARRGCFDGGAQALLDSRTGQSLSTSIRKDGVVGGTAAAGEPVLEQSRRALPERHLPLLATLAKHADPPSSIEFDVRDVEGNDLRDARAGVVGNGQKHEVSITAPCAAVGGPEHGLHLGPREEPEQRLVVPFHRDREAALQYGQFRNVARARVVQKRSNRGQPRIASTNGVTPLLFQMVEKPEQKGRIEVAQYEVDGRLLQSLLRVCEQKPEGVAIRLDRTRRCALLCAEALQEEVLQQRRERRGYARPRHSAPSLRANASKRPPAMAMSSGTAEKYQYVEVTLTCPRYVVSARIFLSTSSPAVHQRTRVFTATV